jgi:L-lysine exporter family protein LysE/ArgO
MTFLNLTSPVLFSPVFFTGMALSLSLIVAIGPQNAHIMRVGLLRQHLWLTVAVCVATDLLLIGIGVSGLAAFGGLPLVVINGMTIAGALVLCVYGWRAMRRFLRPMSLDSLNIQNTGTTITRRQAVGSALALSWLNPHAWLDTAVLIGTASLAYARPDNAVFGLGAATGSMVWFVLFGAAMALLGRHMRAPALWRALDALVAITMWGCAGWLLSGLI